MRFKIVHPVIVLAVLLLAAVACNLGSGGDQNTQPTPTLFPSLTPSLAAAGTPTPTLAPSQTPTGAALPNSGQVPPTQTNCSPQTGWPVYTVVAGDTLGVIAQRTGSTVAQLVTANCLSNAELIYVGQKLYVPRLPVTLTPVVVNTPVTPQTVIPTQNPDAPVITQNLTVQPFWLDTSSRAATYSDTVRISLGEVLNADVVEFYVNDPNGGTPIYIGEDADPWDGAFVDYDFPESGSYTFSAVAANDQIHANSSSFTIRYDPNFSPPGGQRNLLTITPYTQFEGGCRTARSRPAKSPTSYRTISRMMWIVALALGLLAAVVFLWWLLIKTEGVYLGRGIVIWLYDVYASRYDNIKQYDPYGEIYYLAQPILKRLLHVRAPLVLDVATGTGRLPLVLLEYPTFQGRIIGLDLSRKMLSIAANKLAPYKSRVHWLHHPAERLPFPDNTFDLVTCLEALEFMMHPRDVLDELVRVLRPGGLLALTNRQGLDARLMPGKTWSHAELERLLRVDLELLEVDIQPWQVDYRLVLAVKPGSSAPTGPLALAEVWRCPRCGAVDMVPGEGGWRCLKCETRVPVGDDGVIEITRIPGK